MAQRFEKHCPRAFLVRHNNDNLWCLYQSSLLFKPLTTKGQRNFWSFCDSDFVVPLTARTVTQQRSTCCIFTWRFCRWCWLPWSSGSYWQVWMCAVWWTVTWWGWWWASRCQRDHQFTAESRQEQSEQSQRSRRQTWVRVLIFPSLPDAHNLFELTWSQ